MFPDWNEFPPRRKGGRTVKWKTEIVASLYSGRLLCDFGDMHQFAEWFTGEPIFSHQFAHLGFVTQMQNAIAKQIPSLADFPWDGINTGNWQQNRDAAIAQFGAELDLSPMGRASLAKDSFVEPLQRLGQ